MLRQTESVLRSIGLSHKLLEFGEDLFDWVQVGRVGGEKEPPCPSGPDGVADGKSRVAAKIVQNDNVVWTQGRNRHGFDRGLEYLAVDRSVDALGSILNQGID